MEIISLSFGSAFPGGTGCPGGEGLEDSKKREITQTFSTGNNNILRIDNRFGNITVTHWTKNEVSIQVIVEAKARNSTRAQSMLDRVNVDLNKSGNVIKGVTTIRSENNNNNNNERLTIDYYIQMPSELTIELSQRFGNINLPEQTNGKANLVVKYGNIKAGNFSNKTSIEAKYSNVTIGNFDALSMELGYAGSVKTGNGNNVSAESKYSNLTVGEINEMSIELKYGNLKIEKVNRLKTDLKYGEINMNYLGDELDAGEISYSTIKVREVAPTFSRIDASARYGNLELGIPEQAAFKIDATSMKYGSVNLSGFQVTHSDIDTKSFYRYDINGGGKAVIKFDGNNYSNLTIRKR